MYAFNTYLNSDHSIPTSSTGVGSAGDEINLTALPPGSQAWACHTRALEGGGGGGELLVRLLLLFVWHLKLPFLWGIYSRAGLRDSLAWRQQINFLLSFQTEGSVYLNRPLYGKRVKIITLLTELVFSFFKWTIFVYKILEFTNS